MSRKTPTTKTIRSLFSRSGNQCAFEGCTKELISSDHTFLGEVCHIESAEPKGERYNPDSSDEHRRGYSNLILLCREHHIITNNVEIYTVDKMKEMKSSHEKMFLKNNFKVDEAFLHQLKNESDSFWKKRKIAHEDRVKNSDGIIMEFNLDNNILDSFKELSALIDDALRRIDETHEDDMLSDFFIGRGWEFAHIYFPNIKRKIEIQKMHLEIKICEEFLKTNPNDMIIIEKINKLKKIIKDKLKNDSWCYD